MVLQGIVLQYSHFLNSTRSTGSLNFLRNPPHHSAALVVKRNPSSAAFVMGSCFSTNSNMAPPPIKTIEATVCKESDLKVGDLKEFKFEGSDQTCLLVKDAKGEVNAFSGKCTHYGASLSKGDYSEGVIRCPWHGACFNAKTGDIEDFPGLDSLHKYDVATNEDGEIVVRSNSALLGHTRRVQPLCKQDPNNNETIVVIGGGAAAEACIETLRQNERFTGKLVMISNEDTLPYDRPKLSKAMTADIESIQLRNPAYYRMGDIEMRMGSEVTNVDIDQTKVELRSGETLAYDKLVIATGTRPRRPKTIPGIDLKNIYILRTPKDAKAIATSSLGKKVAILGSSFIGMEVAAFLAGKAESVTVIGNSSVPFERSLGTDIGKFIQNMHEEKGNKFIMGVGVESFSSGDSNGDAVREVVMKDGTKVEVDAVILGIGVEPNSDFLKGSQVSINSSGYVNVNEYLQTNVPNVYAAGDIASFPLFLNGQESERVSIGHWQLAHAHGRTAALNLSGEEVPVKSVPFFWTVQFGKSFRYAGFTASFDDIIYDGRVEDGKFAAYFCQGDKVAAVATLMKDPVAAKFANTLLAGQVLTKSDVQSKL